MAAGSGAVPGWLAELDAIERERDALLAGMDPARFNRRPGAGKWSAGECLAHLALAGGLLLDRLEPLLAEARRAGRFGPGPHPYGPLGGWFVRTMESPGRRPLPAPANFVPPSGLPLEEVAARYRAHHTRLRRALEAAEGLALGRIRMASVAKGGGWIRFNAAAWLASTLAHERRHLAQARRAAG